MEKVLWMAEYEKGGNSEERNCGVGW